MSHGPADLLVIGDGPCGCAAALRARQADAQVLVVGSAPPRQNRPLELLEPDVASILETLEVPRGAYRHEVAAMATNWRGDWEARSYFARAQGKPALVDRHIFDEALRAAVIARNIALLRSRAVALQRDGGLWKVRLQSGFVASGARLLMATGRSSFGITPDNRLLRSDRLAAVSARWQPLRPEPADEVASTHRQAKFVLAATNLGWGYAASLDATSGCSVFLSDADLLRRGDQSGRGRLRQLLPSELLPTADSAALLSSFAVRAASTQSRANVAGCGWAMAGDCRIALDPLSGRGVSRALSDGARVAAWLLSDPDAAARRQFRQRHVDEYFAILRRRREVYGSAAVNLRGVFWQRRRALVTQDAHAADS